MITYKIANSPVQKFVVRLSDMATIPCDSGNTDYDNFKYQINHDEAQLQDEDGNTMTPEQAKTYVATLP
jgi:hypothetical protein